MGLENTVLNQVAWSQKSKNMFPFFCFLIFNVYMYVFECESGYRLGNWVRDYERKKKGIEKGEVGGKVKRNKAIRSRREQEVKMGWGAGCQCHGADGHVLG